jgi:hypothetical protein
MISIDDYLKEKELDPRHEDCKVEMQDLKKYLKEFAVKVRDEQIKYSALGSAHHTSINVRNVPDKLNDDLKAHLNVCRVEIF